MFTEHDCAAFQTTLTRQSASCHTADARVPGVASTTVRVSVAPKKARWEHSCLSPHSLGGILFHMTLDFENICMAWPPCFMVWSCLSLSFFTQTLLQTRNKTTAISCFACKNNNANWLLKSLLFFPFFSFLSFLGGEGVPLFTST